MLPERRGKNQTNPGHEKFKILVYSYSEGQQLSWGLDHWSWKLDVFQEPLCPSMDGITQPNENMGKSMAGENAAGARR